jgi:hypothetical protein
MTRRQTAGFKTEAGDEAEQEEQVNQDPTLPGWVSEKPRRLGTSWFSATHIKRSPSGSGYAGSREAGESAASTADELEDKTQTDVNDDRRTDLRTLDDHASWREVCRALNATEGASHE